MAFIQVVPPEQAEGELKDVYERVRKTRGSIANVHAIHSLQPRTMETHIDFYVSVMFGPSGLSRQERETIAVAVSHANKCAYCVSHHGDALARHQKDGAIVDELRRNGRSDRLSDREKALVDHAIRLTLSPRTVTADDAQRLRKRGFGDEEILTATLTAGYFNFVNRLVLGLGVELETAPAAYKY